jgi:hypothetical protein
MESARSTRRSTAPMDLRWSAQARASESALCSIASERLGSKRTPRATVILQYSNAALRGSRSKSGAGPQP